MKLTRLSTIMAVLALAAHRAHAQAPAVVQLPSFSSFGVNTSVSVPDRGSASLGGIGRSSAGSTAFGPAFGPRNRASGSNLSASKTSASAAVHDFDALDRDTLAKAGRKSAEASLANRRLAAARQSTAGQVPPGSVAEARRQQAADAAAQQAEAVQNVKRARDAAAAGKPNAAAMFFKLAGKQASSELKSQIDKEAAALSKESKASHLAKSRSAAAREFSRGR